MDIFDKKPLPNRKIYLLTLLTPAVYLLAATSSHLIGLLPFYFLGLILIARARTYRTAFYSGLLSSFLTAALHINFFLNIFGHASIILWLIISIWPALFILMVKFTIDKGNKTVSLFAIPLILFVLEMISSEIYPLRFSWCTPGFMTHENPQIFGIPFLGVYGFSALILLITILAVYSQKRSYLISGFATFLTLLSFIKMEADTQRTGPKITGIQLEFPEEYEALNALENAAIVHPDSDIFMLSEYSFKDGIPEKVRKWCKANNKFLIAGTTFKSENNNFYNTAVVVNPDGIIEFTQVKAQPIQFFNDGLPAQEQKLWESPWGKIGICICYDLSYATVTDKLVELGAQALIVPTMDVESWGKSEHQLHSRVAPIRAAEYGIPIFKVASSGISQSANRNGLVIATADYPGQNEIISSTLNINEKGSKPFDRYLFYPAITVLILIMLFSISDKRKTLSVSTSLQAVLLSLFSQR